MKTRLLRFRWLPIAIGLCLGFTLALDAPAFAHDMAQMGDMGAIQMNAGDADAMSSEDMPKGMQMDMHDSHIGGGNMGDMKDHMKWTDLRPATAADTERGQQLVATLKSALVRYQDYHTAEAAGYKPFHPEFKNQKVVHFTRRWNAIKAAFTFNPSEPTSLLYERTSGGGYKLIGAMYTAPKKWSEDRLNSRVPLSVARWHQHIDVCVPKKGASAATADWTKFGPKGTITTEAACEAAGGRFYPILFGWMVHVYPWETNPQEVWAH